LILALLVLAGCGARTEVEATCPPLGGDECNTQPDCFVNQCVKTECVRGRCVHEPYPDGQSCFGYPVDSSVPFIGTCAACACAQGP
jgi:hypothetical protein